MAEPGGRRALARRQLAWLVESGADEALGADARDRFAPAPRIQPAPAPPPAAPEPRVRPAPPALASTAALIERARETAEAAATVADLAREVAAFDGCALSRTAKTTVFADGNPAADLMLIGEAPGAEEDRRGLPFVGAAGQLLDRMLAAIGRDRGSAYITNMVYWRPPGNRNPTTEEMALCRPFVDRHIALVQPQVLVCLGAISAKSLLARNDGITRLRGRWFEVQPAGLDRPVATIAIFHPAFLLRQPSQKRLAWRDLQAIRQRLTPTT